MKTSPFWGYNHPLRHFFLYFICTLIWGSTWLVITFQVDTAPPIVSVFYRFLLAAALLFGFALITRKKLSYPLKDHFYFALQGIFIFSVNYMLTYTAETLISSGLMALTFTAVVYFNIFGVRLFFKQPISRGVIAGSLIGGLGMLCIFLNEILHFDSNSKTILGLLIGFAGALSASAGNLLSARSQKKGLPVLATNSFGMLYGCTFTLIVGLASHQNFFIHPTPKFLISLLYLSLFGTVIAFGAYLSLIGHIGAERASYSNVISPVIALALSSIFENFVWTGFIVLGVILCLTGNFLTLKSKAS